MPGFVVSYVERQCSHRCYHAICSSYDRRTAVLTYWWTCERCGERLQPAGTQPYAPKFDPSGNDRYLTAVH